MDAHLVVTEPAARKHLVLRVQDMQHYLYWKDSIALVGSLWLRFIDEGWFDR